MYKIICSCGNILTKEDSDMNKADYFECECGSQYHCFSEDNALDNDCFECEKILEVCNRCKYKRWE